MSKIVTIVAPNQLIRVGAIDTMTMSTHKVLLRRLWYDHILGFYVVASSFADLMWLLQRYASHKVVSVSEGATLVSRSCEGFKVERSGYNEHTGDVEAGCVGRWALVPYVRCLCEPGPSFSYKDVSDDCYPILFHHLRSGRRVYRLGEVHRSAYTSWMVGEVLKAKVDGSRDLREFLRSQLNGTNGEATNLDDMSQRRILLGPDWIKGSSSIAYWVRFDPSNPGSYIISRDLVFGKNVTHSLPCVHDANFPRLSAFGSMSLLWGKGELGCLPLDIRKKISIYLRSDLFCPICLADLRAFTFRYTPTNVSMIGSVYIDLGYCRNCSHPRYASILETIIQEGEADTPHSIVHYLCKQGLVFIAAYVMIDYLRRGGHTSTTSIGWAPDTLANYYHEHVEPHRVGDSYRGGLKRKRLVLSRYMPKFRAWMVNPRYDSEKYTEDLCYNCGGPKLVDPDPSPPIGWTDYCLDLFGTCKCGPSHIGLRRTSDTYWEFGYGVEVKVPYTAVTSMAEFMARNIDVWPTIKEVPEGVRFLEVDDGFLLVPSDCERYDEALSFDQLYALGNDHKIASQLNGVNGEATNLDDIDVVSEFPTPVLQNRVRYFKGEMESIDDVTPLSYATRLQNIFTDKTTYLGALPIDVGEIVKTFLLDGRGCRVCGSKIRDIERCAACQAFDFKCYNCGFMYSCYYDSDSICDEWHPSDPYALVDTLGAIFHRSSITYDASYVEGPDWDRGLMDWDSMETLTLIRFLYDSEAEEYSDDDNDYR